MASPSLTVTPIGLVRSSMRLKFDAPSQPVANDSDRNFIDLVPGHGYENALQDLEGFERIWLIWWFHKNDTWRPMVLPPRGNGKRRGLFATRSPHRPNPIGVTNTRLYGVKGLTLTVGSLDLLDGTPILDIKPYLSGVDAFADCKQGWLDEIEAELAAPPSFAVTVSPVAQQQLNWLKEKFGIDFLPRAIEILERSPQPYRTRRITKYGEGLFRIGCGAWKLIFQLQNDQVTIERVTCGYPLKALTGIRAEEIPDREAQLAFEAQWDGGLEKKFSLS